MLCNDLNNGKTYNGHNWAFQIKSIIDDLGFSDIWLNQNVYTINISVLKERLFDQYKQTWYNDVINSSKLHYYSLFKQCLGPQCEKYLTVVHNHNYRRALCQFRMSAHNLMIEKGRH